MNIAFGEMNSPGETKPRNKGSWPVSRWLLFIVLVLAAHVVLIFTFGTRKPITPRPVTNVPELELAGGSSEWLALTDPTLFALPNRRGFAGPAWLEPPGLEFQWPDEWTTEPPRWLQLPAGELGAVFSQFMQTNRFATFRLPLRPPPRFTVPVVPLEPTFAKTSTLRIEGDLARRPLLTPMKLPLWPYADIIAPSRVQVLVNAAGNVISAVLLLSDNSSEARDADADQYALNSARTARFDSAPSLTVGQLIFDWHTVAPVSTNTPAGQ
jgi:hypothetical protein